MGRVYVVSWHNEGSGGFDWYWDLPTAERAYDYEIGVWKNGDPPTRVRLVEYVTESDVPGEGDTEARQRLTDEIDGNLDLIEIELPALRETEV